MEVSSKGLRRVFIGSALILISLAAAPGWPRALEIRAIRLYQTVGSPVAAKLTTCRYQLTCSHYALGVLERDGFWKGNWKAGKRLLLCSPLHLAFPEAAEEVASI